MWPFGLFTTDSSGLTNHIPQTGTAGNQFAQEQQSAFQHIQQQHQAILQAQNQLAAQQQNQYQGIGAGLTQQITQQQYPYYHQQMQQSAHPINILRYNDKKHLLAHLETISTPFLRMKFFLDVYNYYHTQPFTSINLQVLENEYIECEEQLSRKQHAAQFNDEFNELLKS